MERKEEEDQKYLQAFCQRETNPYKYVSHKDVGLAEGLFVYREKKMFMGLKIWILPLMFHVWHLRPLVGLDNIVHRQNPRLFVHKRYHWQGSEGWLRNFYDSDVSNLLKWCTSETAAAEWLLVQISLFLFVWLLFVWFPFCVVSFLCGFIFCVVSFLCGLLFV